MGPRVLYDKQGTRYLGSDNGSRKAVSETLQVMADEQISRLLADADQLALKILQDHRPLLDAMVCPGVWCRACLSVGVRCELSLSGYVRRAVTAGGATDERGGARGHEARVVVDS